MRRTRFLFQLALLATDIGATMVAYFIAHRIQRAIRLDSIDRFLAYVPLLAILLICIVLS